MIRSLLAGTAALALAGSALAAGATINIPDAGETFFIDSKGKVDLVCSVTLGSGDGTLSGTTWTVNWGTLNDGDAKLVSKSKAVAVDSFVCNTAYTLTSFSLFGGLQNTSNLAPANAEFTKKINYSIKLPGVIDTTAAAGPQLALKAPTAISGQSLTLTTIDPGKRLIAGTYRDLYTININPIL